MRIQHNIMAMTSYRNYNSNVSGLSTNLEKLSSGYRINRAGDDAAGLAISEKMRAQITGLDAAQKNVKDGISLVKTAEGALQEVQDMLHRGIYLSTQSANGTYDNEVDRANLQKEMDALKSEIDRIVDASNFNGKQLLDGSLGAVATITETPGVDAGAGQAAVKASFKIAFNPATAVGDTQRVDVGSLNRTATGESNLGAQISAIFALNTPTTIGGVAYTIAYDDLNSALTFTQEEDPTTDGVSVDDLKTLAESVIKIAGAPVAGVTVSNVVQGKAAVAPNPPASGAVVELDYTDRTGSEVHGTTVTIGDKTYEFVDTGAEATGTNLAVEVAADADDADIALALRNKVREDTTLYDAGGADQGKYSVEATDAKLTITSIKKGADAVAAEVKQTGGGMTLQIGETGEVFNRLTVFIDDMHTEALGLKDVNIGTLSDAQASVAKLRNAVNTVSATRGDLGAAQNRLEHTYSNLSVMEENITDAESTVRDTDVADEMMAYTKNNILIQSAQAMLAQANAVPQGVLQLLQ